MKDKIAIIGDRVWSGYFNNWLEVVDVIDNDNWYFKYKGDVYPAKTKLDYFKKIKAKGGETK